MLMHVPFECECWFAHLHIPTSLRYQLPPPIVLTNEYYWEYGYVNSVVVVSFLLLHIASLSIDLCIMR